MKADWDEWDLVAFFSYSTAEGPTMREVDQFSVSLDRLCLDGAGGLWGYEFWSGQFLGPVPSARTNPGGYAHPGDYQDLAVAADGSLTVAFFGPGREADLAAKAAGASLARGHHVSPELRHGDLGGGMGRPELSTVRDSVETGGRVRGRRHRDRGARGNPGRGRGQARAPAARGIGCGRRARHARRGLGGVGGGVQSSQPHSTAAAYSRDTSRSRRCSSRGSSRVVTPNWATTMTSGAIVRAMSR